MNAPIDMTRFIEAKSDQINADDLMGGPLTIRITGVSASESEQPINVHFEGDNGKAFRPCKTIRRVMVALWGPDASKYVGRAMTLYRDPAVAFGGMQVGGIRVSHMSHIDGEQTVVVMKTKGKRAPMKIKPLAAERAQAAQAAPATEPVNPSARALELQDAIRGAMNEEELKQVWVGWWPEVKTWPDAIKSAVTKVKDDRKAELTALPEPAGDVDY